MKGEIGVGSQKADLSLKFTLDTNSSEAFMVGNAGVSKVSVHSGIYGLTFLEHLPAGAVQSTTITEGGNSVQSRHSMMGDRIIPSQYYGAWAIK